MDEGLKFVLYHIYVYVYIVCAYDNSMRLKKIFEILRVAFTLKRTKLSFFLSFPQTMYVFIQHMQLLKGRQFGLDSYSRRMLWAEALFTNSKRPFVQRLGLVILVLILIKLSQTVQ